MCQTGYRYAQEVDSKVVQLIYLLQRVVFMKFIPNEQILTGNAWEIHENSKSTNLIGFSNQFAKTSKLTD